MLSRTQLTTDPLHSISNCHPERGEAATQQTKSARPGLQSRSNIGELVLDGNKPEMFRVAQHDTAEGGFSSKAN